MRTFNDIKVRDIIYKISIDYSKIEKLTVSSLSRLEGGDVYIQFNNTIEGIMFHGYYSGEYIGSAISAVRGFYIILDHEQHNNDSEQTWKTIGPGEKIYKMRFDTISTSIKSDWVCVKKIGYINNKHTLIIISTNTNDRIIDLHCLKLNSTVIIDRDKTIYSIYKSDAESALVEILKEKLAENLEQIDLLEKSSIKIESYIDRYGKEEEV